MARKSKHGDDLGARLQPLQMNFGAYRVSYDHPDRSSRDISGSSRALCGSAIAPHASSRRPCLLIEMVPGDTTVGSRPSSGIVCPDSAASFDIPIDRACVGARQSTPRRYHRKRCRRLRGAKHTNDAIHSPASRSKPERIPSASVAFAGS